MVTNLKAKTKLGVEKGFRNCDCKVSKTDTTLFFYVLLTVHLSIILVTDQLNAQILVL